MGEEGEGRLLEWGVLSGAYSMLKHWHLRVIVFVAHTHVLLYQPLNYLAVIAG